VKKKQPRSLVSRDPDNSLSGVRCLSRFAVGDDGGERSLPASFSFLVSLTAAGVFSGCDASGAEFCEVFRLARSSQWITSKTLCKRQPQPNHQVFPTWVKESVAAFVARDTEEFQSRQTTIRRPSWRMNAIYNLQPLPYLGGSSFGGVYIDLGFSGATEPPPPSLRRPSSHHHGLHELRIWKTLTVTP
jgi:hypothetical protein